MSLFLNALKCQNKERPPIWLMRQAGRYLPEYQKIKAEWRLYDLFHDVEKIVTITKLPIDLLSFDAAILFSDILTVCDGMGIRYDFHEGLGPQILSAPEEICLQDPQSAYAHIKESIHILKRTLSVPLIGFAGAPFTIATYLIEKGTSKEHKNIKKWLYSDPMSFEKLIKTITHATISYLKCQEQAGVDAIQLFDSWAHILGSDAFRTFSLQPLKKIISELSVPVIVFARGSFVFAKDLVSLKPAALSMDWAGDLQEARKMIPSSIALQGNLDPMVLFAPKEIIKKHTHSLLSKMQDDPGFIFNLGHGILPDTPVDNVKYLVDYVRAYRKN